MRLAVFAALLIAFLGCKTAHVGPPLITPVPKNLTSEDVEITIVAMIEAPEAKSQNRQPTQNQYTVAVMGNSLDAILWDLYQNRPPGKNRSSGWFVESWVTGRIQLGYRHGVHYLHVPIDTTGRVLSLRIAESHNLNQKDGTIHKNALLWLQGLDTDIREALGQASTIKQQLNIDR